MITLREENGGLRLKRYHSHLYAGPVLNTIFEEIKHSNETQLLELLEASFTPVIYTKESLCKTIESIIKIAAYQGYANTASMPELIYIIEDNGIPHSFNFSYYDEITKLLFGELIINAKREMKTLPTTPTLLVQLAYDSDLLSITITNQFNTFISEGEKRRLMRKTLGIVHMD